MKLLPRMTLGHLGHLMLQKQIGRYLIKIPTMDILTTTQVLSGSNSMALDRSLLGMA